MMTDLCESNFPPGTCVSWEAAALLLHLRVDGYEGRVCEAQQVLGTNIQNLFTDNRLFDQMSELDARIASMILKNVDLAAGFARLASSIILRFGAIT
jgi:hypothetical protein